MFFTYAKDNKKEVDIVIELPKEKILCEVKYRNGSYVPETDAIVALSREENTKERFETNNEPHTGRVIYDAVVALTAFCVVHCGTYKLSKCCRTIFKDDSY
jgi:hypothetical protein